MLENINRFKFSRLEFESFLEQLELIIQGPLESEAGPLKVDDNEIRFRRHTDKIYIQIMPWGGGGSGFTASLDEIRVAVEKDRAVYIE